MDKKRTNEEYQQQLRQVDDGNCLRAIKIATTPIDNHDFTRRHAIKALEFAVDFSDEREWPKELRKYLSNCISVWLTTDCDPKESARAFNVQRPSHGTGGRDNNNEKMIAARVYYLMRGRRKGYDNAIEKAGLISGLSESTVKELISRGKDGKEGKSASYSVVAVYLGMMKRNPDVAHRCFINPPRKKYKKLHK